MYNAHISNSQWIVLLKWGLSSKWKVFNLPTLLQNSGVNKTPQYADFGVE